jgi:SAM-dependent methyltransferase
MRPMQRLARVTKKSVSPAVPPNPALETLFACLVCGGERLQRLPVRNLNSHDPVRAARLAQLLGDDFFLEQAISVCASCDHVFQSTRPTPRGLATLYERFSESLAKSPPTEATMVEYVLRTNAKDYVSLVAGTLEMLEEQRLLDGVQSVLEIRTFGGALLAMLRGRGVDHCEGGYIQEFDADVARRMFGNDRLVPFSFASPIDEFQPQLDQYDLIILHEGLTHSHDPARLLAWVADRLSPTGSAVFFREPDTPAYRPYLPLEIVFNNFHLHLFNGATLMALAQREAPRLSHKLVAERHPAYRRPVYLDLVLQPANGSVDSAPQPRRYDVDFYRSWIRRDESRVLQVARRAQRSAAYRLERAFSRLSG